MVPQSLFWLEICLQYFYLGVDIKVFDLLLYIYNPNVCLCYGWFGPLP